MKLLIIPFLFFAVSVIGQKKDTTYHNAIVELITSGLSIPTYDTIPCLLLVSDTFKYNRTIYSYDGRAPEYYYKTEVWQIAGYEVGRQEPYRDMGLTIGYTWNRLCYLNEKKKPLPKNWAVWMKL